MSALTLRYPHKLTITNIVYFVVLWVNAFPVNNGIYSNLPPRDIVARNNLDCNKHYQPTFRVYCEVNGKPYLSNTIITYAYEAIDLVPTGKINGA